MERPFEEPHICPPQMDQHHCRFQLGLGQHPAQGPSTQGSPGWQPQQLSPHAPTPAPEGAVCSLLKENSTSQAFVRRELDCHLPTNEARLCKQRKGSQQVASLSGKVLAQKLVLQVPTRLRAGTCVSAARTSWLRAASGALWGWGFWPPAQDYSSLRGQAGLCP
jgi:hypothetical protein